MVLMDGKPNSNIVHYGSMKSKRVTKTVLSAELYAMVLRFDIRSTSRLSVKDIFNKKVPFYAYTDSWSLYYCLTC